MNNQQINLLVKDSMPKILGYLIRLVGDFDDAEDLQQEVLLIALKQWPDSEVDNPLAWLFTVAKNKATDFQRRKKIGLSAVQHSISGLTEEVSGVASIDSLEDTLNDDLLRLIFTCCHPALAPEMRVALTLKTVVGLSLSEVAKAFLVSDATMQQRLVRVKRKIKLAGISYEIPDQVNFQSRLSSVLQTIYLLFNEGYSATHGEQLIRSQLCDEAINLGRLVNQLFVDIAELKALLAVMLLQDSRREARLSNDGLLVLMDDQDRRLWDRAQIQEGLLLLEQALALQQIPGQYQLQAAIAALHAQATSPAASPAKTDWQEIILLFETLLKYNDTAVVRLNYAVALSKPTDAITDFRQALTLTQNNAEQAYIKEKLASRTS